MAARCEWNNMVNCSPRSRRTRRRRTISCLLKHDGQRRRAPAAARVPEACPAADQAPTTRRTPPESSTAAVVLAARRLPPSATWQGRSASLAASRIGLRGPGRPTLGDRRRRRRRQIRRRPRHPRLPSRASFWPADSWAASTNRRANHDQRGFAGVRNGHTERRLRYQSGLLPQLGPAGYKVSRRDCPVHTQVCSTTRTPIALRFTFPRCQNAWKRSCAMANRWTTSTPLRWAPA